MNEDGGYARIMGREREGEMRSLTRECYVETVYFRASGRVGVRLRHEQSQIKSRVRECHEPISLRSSRKAGSVANIWVYK